ncbi:trimethylamine methyltransferase family protein [Altererythrobacter arenosus]|uniref:Methyltransferase n=1 Tax=Altererythrobacter arenosus TaxID=3032592 RepID=A0ABY8FRE6_9SPHN|nr:trimethylamine methyltransferase family protein [Altererythrobacter sp. CAU 1644]WFL77332.1 trimethylamine methyltransferase family protein [Altererythrobacter sp. CAU 1644]
MAREGRSGGRRGRAAANAAEATPRAPYIKRNIPPYEVLGDADLAKIEENAETILSEIGIDIKDDPETIEIFVKAGATADGERVRFPRGMCRGLIQATAPRQFTQYARNPANNVEIGGNNTVLVPAYGSPFVYSREGGRRYATIEDFRNFVKLAYMADSLHHSGGTICEPVDLPVNKRHFDMVYSHIKYSDKAFMGSVTHPSRAEDSVAMAKIVFGDDFVENNCVLINLINANSPMTFDDTMLGSLKVYARHNQAVMVSPFIVAGAMSPVTVAAVAAQSLAEGMVGMSLAQLVRPGAPVIYGNFVSSMSMQSGAPTFGSPEASLVINVGAALARRLGVPFRSAGGFTASKVPDAQAAYEAANTLQQGLLAGVNFMLHTAGWLEGGLAMGYEKFVMDCDQAAMMAVYANGVDMSENGQAMDALREVGPGQHFLGCSHTQANFKSAFYRSTIADNNSYEQWVEDGKLDAEQRAEQLYKQLLADYVAPELDPEIDARLIEFMETRKASFPDSNIS